jgi:hypothetical protein
MQGRHGCRSHQDSQTDRTRRNTLSASLASQSFRKQNVKVIFGVLIALSVLIVATSSETRSQPNLGRVWTRVMSAPGVKNSGAHVLHDCWERGPLPTLWASFEAAPALPSASLCPTGPHQSRPARTTPFTLIFLREKLTLRLL